MKELETFMKHSCPEPACIGYRCTATQHVILGSSSLVPGHDIQGISIAIEVYVRMQGSLEALCGLNNIQALASASSDCFQKLLCVDS